MILPLSNRSVRIIVSVIFIPLILTIVYQGSYAFLLLVTAIGLTAYFEYVRMAKQKEANAHRVIGFSGVLAIITNGYFHYTELEVIIILTVSALMLVELFRNKGSAIYNIGSTMLGIFYIGVFLSTLVEIREMFSIYEQGAFVIYSIFASIWICDSAAYFGGLSFGKHRLFERVSPKKSWEGAIFGFVFAITTMLLARYLLLDFLSWSDALFIGAIVGILGQTGDLVESLLKRDAGVKDSSQIIPGHGGIFDRFDSLIAVSPVIYIYIKYIAL